jgi:hypothetical protein
MAMAPGIPVPAKTWSRWPRWNARPTRPVSIFPAVGQQLLAFTDVLPIVSSLNSSNSSLRTYSMRWSNIISRVELLTMLTFSRIVVHPESFNSRS